MGRGDVVLAPGAGAHAPALGPYVVEVVSRVWSAVVVIRRDRSVWVIPEMRSRRGGAFMPSKTAPIRSSMRGVAAERSTRPAARGVEGSGEQKRLWARACAVLASSAFWPRPAIPERLHAEPSCSIWG